MRRSHRAGFQGAFSSRRAISATMASAVSRLPISGSAVSAESLMSVTWLLPLPKGQKATDKRDYLFVAIDDFSREPCAAILPDKTADSAAKFLTVHLIDPCPYLIECVYSDNGTEYKGSANHAFGVACYENGIGQKFTRVVRPQTNGKVERVIRTLMEMWHGKQLFDSPEHRRKELCRFVNFYNTVKPHRSLNSDTPFEVLQASFSTCGVNNATFSYTLHPPAPY